MIAAKYRKKPLVVEAIRFTGGNGKRIERWAALHGSDAVQSGVGSYEGRAEDIMRITTLEGVMAAGPGDWIIRGVAGEFYPCKHDIFVTTYDRIRGDGVLTT